MMMNFNDESTLKGAVFHGAIPQIFFSFPIPEFHKKSVYN